MSFMTQLAAALAISRDAVAAEAASMAATNPPTAILSPGYIALGYGDQGIQHKTRIRLTLLGNPYDTQQMSGLAQAWAIALQEALNTSENIDTWYAYDTDARLVQMDMLGAPVQGANTNITLASQSFTETITGHGTSARAGLLAGEARMRIFPHASQVPLRGEKFRLLASYTPLQDLAMFLGTTQLAWADFYGQKAGVRGHCPIQQNAFAQKQQGW